VSRLVDDGGLLEKTASLRNDVTETMPNSRERSLVLTHLDEVRHWLTDAFTVVDDD
jgi:hypothetical protein